MTHHRPQPGACLLVLLLQLVCAAICGAEDRLLGDKLPPGIYLRNQTDVPSAQRDEIGRKLGATLASLTNSVLQVHGRTIQMNVMTAVDDAGASSLYRALSKVKPAPFVVRKDRTVVEYVGKDLDEAIALKTSYELRLVPKPGRVRYRLITELAPIARADYMACNPLFDQFLALRTAGASGDTSGAIGEIRKLAKRMQFGRTLVLRGPNSHGSSAATHAFEPAPVRTEQTGATARYTFDSLPTLQGVPYAKATLEIPVEGSGLTPAAAVPDGALTAATAWWPAADPKIKALAAQITRGKTTNEAKATAILAWLAPGQNLKYGGQTGSRWGTLKVLEQKFGHCWDFADCFVSLCRAAGVPSRQVAGWLYGSSGHVWAEYYRDDQKAWQQVDATGGGALACGIYHIAYFTTEDGEMPLLYLAMPKITAVSP